MLSYFPPTSPYAGEMMRETVRPLFSPRHPLRRRTHERRRVFGDSWLWLRTCVVFHSTHTHTQRGIAAEQHKENEMCHSPLNCDRCRRDSRGVVSVIANSWKLLLFAASSWVSFLTHTAYAASVWVMRKMRGRSCVVLLSARPLLLLLRALSSHTPLMQQVCRKREGRGSG